jgi:hypothetical protein
LSSTSASAFTGTFANAGPGTGINVRVTGNSLTGPQSGDYVLSSTDEASPSLNATIFTPVIRKQLEFITQPPSTVFAGVAMNPITIQITDQNNNPLKLQNVAVTLRLNMYPGSLGHVIILNGRPVTTYSSSITLFTDANGRVSFTNVDVGTPGYNYQFLVSASGYTTVGSNRFSVFAYHPTVTNWTL